MPWLLFCNLVPTAVKHPCLAPVGHGKFAVLMASNMLDFRYRRILTKLKINNKYSHSESRGCCFATCVTADKHPCLAAMCRFKFAVLTVADRRQLRYRRAAMCRFKFAVLKVGDLLRFRYRRVLTKLKINNNYSHSESCGCLFIALKNCCEPHSGFYSYLLFINRAFKP